MINTILSIIKEGIKLWSEERRARFLNEYHDVLEEVQNAKNKEYPEYTDIDIDIANGKLRILLEAFSSELKGHVVENLQQET